MNTVSIDTPRLLLRQWQAEDAPALYELAKDPRIGPLCGWPPYSSIQVAHDSLRTVLAIPGAYAITRRQDEALVGSIALRLSGSREDGLVGDIGYWVGVPFWGNGYATEAGIALIDHARTLGASALVLSYFDGNEASRRVSEKLGFVWETTEENVPYPLLGTEYTVHRTRLLLA